nr:MAG TPA: hypothetical protein [Caudoviricetes sp.]
MLLDYTLHLCLTYTESRLDMVKILKTNQITLCREYLVYGHLP